MSKGLPSTSSIQGVKSGTLESVLSKSLLTEFYAHRGESRSMWERKKADGIALRTSPGRLEDNLQEKRYTTTIIPASTEQIVSNVKINSSSDTKTIEIPNLWSYFSYKDETYDHESPVRLCGVFNSLFRGNQMQPRKLPIVNTRKYPGFDVVCRSVFNEIVVGPEANSWVVDLLKDYKSNSFSFDSTIRSSELE